MARLTLSKSSLSKASGQLKTYERFLPSLDLKKKQLIAERAKAKKQLQSGENELASIRQRIRDELPMLAVPLPGLEGIAQVKAIQLGEENIVGTLLPILQRVDVKLRDYALLSKPHWLDRLEELLKQALERAVLQQVLARRLYLLEEAVQTITQRVNLFEKVLIPRTRDQIKTIRVFLADGERAAVVRAKIAKRKRAAAS